MLAVMPMPALSSRRRGAAVGAVVLVLHGLMLAGWLQLKPGLDRKAADQSQPVLMLRLLPPPRAVPQPTLSTANATARTAPPAPRLRPRLPPPAPQAEALASPPPAASPQAITWPTEAARPEASADRTAGAASPPPVPLDLSLPRAASAPWRRRNPALDDSRSNDRPLTFEQRLALGMGGSGPWAEERLDPDTIRFRRGAQCQLATRTRAGQLGLANGAFKDAWVVRPC
jgi:hypothetical protein